MVAFDTIEVLGLNDVLDAIVSTCDGFGTCIERAFGAVAGAGAGAGVGVGNGAIAEADDDVAADVEVEPLDKREDVRESNNEPESSIKESLEKDDDSDIALCCVVLLAKKKARHFTVYNF